MAESIEKDLKGAGRPWWIVAAAVAGALLIAIAYAWLRSVFEPDNLAEHGQLGDALAPIAELLMLAALLAALYSAHLQRVELGLQRKELALQRKEMRESREEMIEQRRQLERSAKAQEALATAQLRAVRAQHRANLLALRATEVQMLSALMPPNSPDAMGAIIRDLDPTLGQLRTARDSLPIQIAEESRLESEVAALLGDDPERAGGSDAS